MKKISVLGVCFMMFLIVGCSKGVKVTIKDNLEMEYGDKLDHSLLFDKGQSDDDVSVKEVKRFDSKKIGEQDIIVIFSNADDKTTEEKIKVTVKDTKKPVIKLKKDKVEITAGDKFNAASNIESVKDPVDGDIKKSDDKKLTKNGYIITSNVNAKKAGSYTVKITAYDVNGNKAEGSYKVTVKKKPQEKAVQKPASQTSSSNSYSTNQGSTSYSKPASGSTNSAKKPTQSKPQQSTTTAKVCPNGKKPIDPNLPCDTILTGREDNYSKLYKNTSGIVVTFPTAEAAYDWAWNEVLNNPELAGKYSSFVTLPLGRNNNTECYGIHFD